MDTDTINSQLVYLEETKSLLKEAIVNKGQTIQDTDVFRSYVDKIAQISTLSTETSDATATASDIAKGQIAYANGQKLVGALPKLEGGSTLSDEAYNVVYTEGNNVVKYYYKNVETKIFTKDSILIISADGNTIANAIGLTADKIIEGNTILGIVGTGKTSEDLQAQLNAQDELIATQRSQIEELKSLLSDKASNITTETITAVNNILGNEEV